MEENIEELVSQCLAENQESRAPVYKALIGKFTGSKGSEIKWRSSKKTTEKLLEVLQEDIISENFDISYESSGLLGCVLAKEEFLEKVDLDKSSSLLTALLDAIEHHIEKKSDKRILIRGLWSLSNSMFKNEVYGSNLKKIFFIINQVLGGHNEISSLAQLETLKAVLQLQDAIHSQMVNNCGEYIKPVFMQLFHEHDKVRDVSYRCVYNLKNHMEENPQVTQVLIPDLKSTYTKKMLRLVTAECSDVLRVWRLVVGLLGKHLHPGTSLINLLLEVVEKAFKSQQSTIRIDAFLCWQALMDNFSIDEKVITNPKRLKLLIAPLKVNNAKTEDIATAKLQAWWHLVVKLGKNAHSNFDLVVAPLLRFCFGAGSSSGVASGLSEVYLMKAGATSASPGRKFVGLHLLCAEILAQIISTGLDLEDFMSYNAGIKSLTAPVLNSGQGFVHSHPLLFGCIKEAIRSLNPNDRKHQVLGVFIIQCVLGQLKVVLSSEVKPETVEAVKALFMLISAMESLCRPGDTQSLFVYKFLEMVMNGSVALPRAVLNSRQYHISRGNTMKDMMNGTLCDHIIRQLCTPSMLHYATIKEGYFVIWESVLTNCNPSTGRLGFLQSVVSELDVSAKVLCPANPAALVRLWGITANTLVQHIKETQNIEQGDSSEHDWSCVYAILSFPLRHSADALSSAERHHYHTIMKNWSQLWGEFVQLTPLVDTAEPNTEVEDISCKLIDIYKEKLTGPPDCHVSALELIADVLHIMIEGLRFSELGKTSAKLISSPAKPRKKPHVLKNLASSVELFCHIFPKVLRMTSERRQKISTQLINVALLVFDGIKKQENMIKYLISQLTDVMHKAVQVNLTALFGGDIEKKFVDMWSKYCGLIEIQCKLEPEYADEHLSKFAPLFQASLESANKGIKQEMSKLWKSSFADSGASIPSSLYDALKEAGLPPASLADTVAALEDTLSQSPKENVPTHISGSFLNREKGITGTPKLGTPKMATPKMATPKGTPKGSSLKLPLEETPKTRRRNTIGTPLRETPLSKRKIELQDMKDEEFVRVSSPRTGRRVLTEHQAEKMKERRSDIPALYNDLTQTSSSQLPVQFTTQNSLSEEAVNNEKSLLKKTENIINDLEDISFTGRILKETNSEDPIVEQFQEVNEDNDSKKEKKKSSKAKEKKEKEKLKKIEEKNKRNEDSRKLLNDNENAMSDYSLLSISNGESDKILNTENIQNNSNEDLKDIKNKNNCKDAEIEEDSKVKNSKKSLRGKTGKTKEKKEVLQEIEDSEREDFKVQENKSKVTEIEDDSKVKNSKKALKGKTGKSKEKEELLQEIENSETEDFKELEKSKSTEDAEKPLEDDIEIEERKKTTRSGKSLLKDAERSSVSDNDGQEIKKYKSSKKKGKLDKETKLDKKNNSISGENEDKILKHTEDSDMENPGMRKLNKEKNKSLENISNKEKEKIKSSEGKEVDDITSLSDSEQSTEVGNNGNDLHKTVKDDQKIKNIESDTAKNNKDDLNTSEKNTFENEVIESPLHRRKAQTPSKKNIEDIKESLKGIKTRNKVQYGEVFVSPSIVRDKKISTNKLSVKLSHSVIKKHLKESKDITDSITDSESDEADIPSSQEFEVDTSSSKRSILNLTRTPVDKRKGKRKRDLDSLPVASPGCEEPNDKKQRRTVVTESQSDESVINEEQNATTEDTPLSKKKSGRKSKKKSVIDVTDVNDIDDKIDLVQVSHTALECDGSEDLFKTSDSYSPKLTRSGRKIKAPNKDMPEPMTPPGKQSTTVKSGSQSPAMYSKAKRSLSIEKPSVQKKITDLFSKEPRETDSEDSETCNEVSIDIHKLSGMEDELEDSCIPMQDESTGESETSEKECEVNMDRSEIEIESKSILEKSVNDVDEEDNQYIPIEEGDITAVNDGQEEAKKKSNANVINSIDCDITDLSLDTSGFNVIMDMDITDKSIEDSVIHEEYISSELPGNDDHCSTDSESDDENDTIKKFSNLKKDADLSSPSGRLNSSKELTNSPQKSTIEFPIFENLEQDTVECNDEFDFPVENEDLAERILKRQSLTNSPEAIEKEGKCDQKDSAVLAGSKSSTLSTGDSSLSSFESGQRMIDETPTPPTDSPSPPTLSSVTEAEESSRPKPNISIETTSLQQMEEESSPVKSKFSNALGTPERKKFAASKFSSSRAAMLVACAKQNIKNRSGEGESPSKCLDTKPRLSNSPNSRKSLPSMSPSNTPTNRNKRKYSESGSSDRRPWAKHKPSPGASPASSILKKKDDCLDSSYSETPSPPPSKSRRVSFADPPVSEAVEIPPSPKTKGIRAQKRLDMTKATSPDKEPLRYREINKLSSPEKATQTQTQEDMEAVAMANCTEPFYPNLVHCEHSIRQVADELTAPTLVEGLISLMKDKGIITVGDLCRQSEADIHALPLRAPKHIITFGVLKEYEHRIRGRMMSMKNPSVSYETNLCMGTDDLNDKAGPDTTTKQSNAEESDQKLVETVLSGLNSTNGALLLSSIMSHLDHSTVMEVVCNYMKHKTTRVNQDVANR